MDECGKGSAQVQKSAMLMGTCHPKATYCYLGVEDDDSFVRESGEYEGE